MRFLRFLGSTFTKILRETYEFAAGSVSELGRSFELWKRFCLDTYLVSLRFSRMKLGTVFDVLFISYFDLLASRSDFFYGFHLVSVSVTGIMCMIVFS